MNLARHVHQQAAGIDWLCNAGDVTAPSFTFSYSQITDRRDALYSLFSTQWADATTLAQGELTGFLARFHYNEYGTVWNALAKESRALLEPAMCAALSKSLEDAEWQNDLVALSPSPVDRTARVSLGAKVSELLDENDPKGAIEWQIVTNMNRAALEISYRSKFPKVPIFFENLLTVYASGRLPCGWAGDLNEFPKGELLVY